MAQTEMAQSHPGCYVQQAGPDATRALAWAAAPPTVAALRNPVPCQDAYADLQWAPATRAQGVTRGNTRRLSSWLRQEVAQTGQFLNAPRPPQWAAGAHDDATAIGGEVAYNGAGGSEAGTGPPPGAYAGSGYEYAGRGGRPARRRRRVRNVAELDPEMAAQEAHNRAQRLELILTQKQTKTQSSFFFPRQ